MNTRDQDRIRAAAEKVYDATIAAGGTVEAATNAAERAAQDASWPSIRADAVRSGILEIVGAREDGEIIYRRTELAEPDNNPVQQ